MDTKKRNIKINKLIKSGLSYGSVARMFSLSRARIHQICSGYISPTSQSYKMKKIYNAVMTRDDLTCQWGKKCKGKFIETKNLVIHHINFNNKDNRQENLITLCRKCHGSFHRNNHINKNIEKKLIFVDKIRDKKIYKCWKSGLTYKEIAKKYNLTYERIRQIIKRERGDTK